MEKIRMLGREYTPLEKKILEKGYDLSDLRAVATQAYNAQKSVKRTMGRYPVNLSEFANEYGKELLRLIVLGVIKPTRYGGRISYQFTPDGTEFAGRKGNSDGKTRHKMTTSPAYTEARRLTRIAVGTQARKKKN